MYESAPAKELVPLFRQILGNNWDRLDEQIQRFHDVTTIVRAAGIFRIRHGNRWLARFLRWLLSLPADGDAVDVRLMVTRCGDREHWARQFAGRPLDSFLWRRPNGLLAEQMGPWEIQFHLANDRGTLSYHHGGARFCLGSIRIPVPRWCAPRVLASERSNCETGGIDCSVQVNLPLLGLLIAYDGTLHAVEERG
jgi:Domain of unknown function (DUF4166)